MKYLLSIFGAATAVSALAIRNECNRDNCFRAVINTARPGLIDCSSYLRATVTPPTSTFTDTSTKTEWSTSTDPQTFTDTVHVTATETSTSTPVTTIDSTLTITRTLVAKRQQTETPSAIPAYASACSGSVRYSSACSCNGVFPTATTVAAPSTTVTETTTITSTDVVSPTVTTVTTTITDHTTTSVVVAATRTEYLATVTIEPQCTNLASSPANYRSVGLLIIAGVGQSQARSATSPEDCCSSCYRNGNCFGFSWGNYDPAYFDENNWEAPPPVGAAGQCFHQVIVTGGCNYDYVAFGPSPFGGAPAGGQASFGYGGCSVSPW
ncbi:hypothetical protein Dda_6625 [Drechslerella dactyloides]|uniref:Apple domain-containing protein n=1 Tax=Drechslerella dactyloides TaxID=74499 RepID=A0AAD6NHK2_DREDA|nr:hypothetical protein Dda_6625 [Drechslerella dactyloides]